MKSDSDSDSSEEEEEEEDGKGKGGGVKSNEKVPKKSGAVKGEDSEATTRKGTRKVKPGKDTSSEDDSDSDSDGNSQRTLSLLIRGIHPCLLVRFSSGGSFRQ